MAKLLWRHGDDVPARRDPDVPIWLEVLRAATYRRVDLLTADDLAALATGEADEGELDDDDPWPHSIPEGRWVNWFGDIWDDSDLPYDPPEPYTDPEREPLDPAEADYEPPSGSLEPSAYAPANGARGPFEEWEPGTLPPRTGPRSSRGRNA